MTNATRYSIAVRQTEVDGELFFEGRAKEFPHLVAYETSHAEAYEAVLALIEDSLEILAAEGTKIPVPAEHEVEYSGRVTLRLPKSIHKILAEAADSDDCSLNQFIVNSLCEVIGFRRAQEDITRAWQPQVAKHRNLRGRHLTVVSAQSLPVEKKAWTN